MGVGGQRHAPAALPRERDPYLSYRSLGGPQGLSGLVRKISSAPGFDARTVQPIASRYTDCAIPAHLDLVYTRSYCICELQHMVQVVCPRRQEKKFDRQNRRQSRAKDCTRLAMLNSFTVIPGMLISACCDNKILFSEVRNFHLTIKSLKNDVLA